MSDHALGEDIQAWMLRHIAHLDAIDDMSAVMRFRDRAAALGAENERLRERLDIYAKPIPDARVAAAIEVVNALAASLRDDTNLGDDEGAAIGIVCNAAEDGVRARAEVARLQADQFTDALRGDKPAEGSKP